VTISWGGRRLDKMSDAESQTDPPARPVSSASDAIARKLMVERLESLVRSQYEDLYDHAEGEALSVDTGNDTAEPRSYHFDEDDADRRPLGAVGRWMWQRGECA
jgi:hypothetical protein